MVISGIYRFSRNPMYVGLLLVLTAWAIYLSNALAFLFLPTFVACLTRLQIVPEERVLAAKFGDAFTAYRQSVRRWL
nr:L409 [uncultured bacterium]